MNDRTGEIREMNEAMRHIDTRNIWQKAVDRLFPHKYCFVPDAPDEYKDCLHHTVDCHFNFIDRLRVLATGHVRVVSKIVTENMVGNTVVAAESFPVGRNVQ